MVEQCCHKLFPLGALGCPRPLCDTPSSARGSTHEFSCESSLCRLDRRLNRQRVCSTPFCIHGLSGREPLKHAQKRICCGTHCTRESCSTFLQPSSSLQRTRRSAQILLLVPNDPCPSSRQSKRELPDQEVVRSRAMPRFFHAKRKWQSPLWKDNMANKVVGCVWMMRPMYFNRPRIMMQSYEGTFSVRQMSR